MAEAAAPAKPRKTEPRRCRQQTNRAKPRGVWPCLFFQTPQSAPEDAICGEMRGKITLKMSPPRRFFPIPRAGLGG